MMALDPGLYCIHHAQGGPAPGPTGLPGVRITAAPGAQRGNVQVSSFTPDGWIGLDSAALVRVTSARSEVLVTVYQTQDSRSEAPKLQVLLLAPEAAPGPIAAPKRTEAQTPQQAPQQSQQQPPQPSSQPAPPQAGSRPGAVEVVAHIYGRGDVAGRLGDWMGEPGSQRWIEGFGVAPPEGINAADIEYQAVLGRGWLSPWSEGGQFCGSRGMSLPILGMRIRLRGAAAKTHRIALAASFVDGTRIGPVGGGDPCEADSLAALESFQLTLIPTDAAAAKDGTPKGKPSKTAAEPAQPAPAKPATSRKPGRAAAAQPAAASAAPAKPERARTASAKAVAVPVKATATRPVVAKPVVAKPAVAKPASAKPASAKPQAAKPEAVRPGRAGAASKPPASSRRR